ncbi:MAG TPA: tRNA (adenosine(37)-N6)-threonylcarbamoyltransferase complex ATPase subunit type 1 TsaE [Candidatus Moranbacteria bacterium]|nr:tRNA (adenosine(37)-N6)-threonylcarbamoyltransferase complex ATPase subunit type 1 TsaE [Candidatus Moranbacteria bacterium]HAT74469.1 tRNA (adenosine(37)-N6)-threonylcarbamoyltransferase complex ATPase subunit type 1 TsaE [Candidatus Moranbacteria bacterium]
MRTEFITEKFEETRKMGKILAKELRGGEVICLSGELGAGKTSFAQGLLEGLGAEKPYTSPSFVVMKEYKITKSNSPAGEQNIYHIDAYRINEKDLLNLGWEEIISDPKNIAIVEWANRVEKIIPARAVWIKFEWLGENRRRIILGKAKKPQDLPKIRNRAKNIKWC